MVLCIRVLREAIANKGTDNYYTALHGVRENYKVDICLHVQWHQSKQYSLNSCVLHGKCEHNFI